MFEFVLTSILFSAVGVMLFIVARALPRVEEEPSTREPLLDRLLKSGVPERIDAALNATLAKLLRKARVVLLKTDNKISALLKKVKPNGNGNGKPSLDFTEIISSSADKNTNEKDVNSSG